MSPLYSDVPQRHDSETAWNQDPEIEAAKWNSAIINFIIYTWSFPTATCPNVFSDKEGGKKSLLEPNTLIASTEED